VLASIHARPASKYLHSSKLIDSEDLRIWYQPPDMGDQDRMDEDNEDQESLQPEVKAFWTLYIDILFISLDGNPFDAAWAAVLAALKDVRLPKAYWDPDQEMILCEDAVSDSKRLTLRGLPIAVTALVFRAKEQLQGRDKKHWILVDPDTFEEGLCEESVTVVIDCDKNTTNVLCISKSGGTVVGTNEMRDIIGLAEKRWAELSQLLAG